MSALRFVVSTPAGERVRDGVVALRFEGPDGHRGVLPGHERGCSTVRSGAVHVARREEGREVETYLATEGGLVWIEPGEVRLLTRWAEEAPDLDRLVASLERREAHRRRLDERARARLESHDAATRRALARLQREVAR